MSAPELNVALAPREARALARAASLTRTALAGARDLAPSPAGEAPLEIAHAKVLNALERAGEECEAE